MLSTSRQIIHDLILIAKGLDDQASVDKTHSALDQNKAIYNHKPLTRIITVGRRRYSPRYSPLTNLYGISNIYYLLFHRNIQ